MIPEATCVQAFINDDLSGTGTLGTRLIGIFVVVWRAPKERLGKSDDPSLSFSVHFSVQLA